MRYRRLPLLLPLLLFTVNGLLPLLPLLSLSSTPSPNCRYFC